MAGVSFGSYFAFGYNDTSYSKIGSSLITSFHNLLNEKKYFDLEDTNKVMAIVITLITAIALVFILMILFDAIIMSHYSLLTRSTQLKADAMTKVKKDEAKDWISRFTDLICCKSPADKEESDIENHAYEKHQDPLQVKKKKENSRELSSWKVFLINLNALCCSPSLTIASRNQRQKEAMKVIKQEQYATRMKEREEHEHNVMNRIVQTIVYLIFLGLFITAAILHISVERLSTANNALKVIMPTEFYKEDYIEYSELTAVLTTIIDNVYYSYDENNQQDEFRDDILDNTIVFSNPFFRIIYKRNMVYENNNNNTKDACPFKTVDESFSSKVNENDWEGMVYEKGENLRNDERGVVIEFPYARDTINRNGKTFNELVDIIDKMTVDRSKLTIEFFGYSPNSESFLRAKVIIRYKNTGVMTLKIRHYAFLFDQYSTTAKKARAALEIIILLFILYFTFEELCAFIEIFREVRAEDHINRPKANEDDSRCGKAMAFLYIDPKVTRKQEGCGLVFYFILGVFKLLYHNVKQFIISLVKYLFSSFFNLIKVASIVLCYIIAITW